MFLNSSRALILVNGSKIYVVPEALNFGYYLAELSTEGLTSQAFYVSDITAYTITDKDNTLFWLNDLNMLLLKEPKFLTLN